MFPRNQWYAAAWDRDVGQKPFARTICNEAIVMYRKPDRSLNAMEDLCPHRLLPLSKGYVDGEKLVCGYHGLTFGDGGRCVHMPNQDTIHPEAHVKGYPIAEKHRFVWIWIGDSELADEDKIPDMHWCDSPEWAFDGGTMKVNCDFKLLVDNLMDLSHETYVHASSIGQHEINEVPAKTTATQETATIQRWMMDVVPPPFWEHNFRSNMQVDRWQSCEFSLPANVVIDVGVAKAGTGAVDGDRSQGISARVIDIMTPETETTTHYHWGFARDFEIHDQGLTTRIRDAQNGVFNEDLDVLENQQIAILKHPERKLLNFNIDSGGIRARKIIEKAIQKYN